MATVRPMETPETVEEAMGGVCAVIFKHSTRCPISRRAKEEFERFAEKVKGEVWLYEVDVIKNRKVSMEIERRTGVAHQSPQVVVLRDGKVYWHESHWNIRAKGLEEAVEWAVKEGKKAE